MNRVVIPAAATLLAVVGLIATAGYNKSDEALARLTLTERELRLWSAVATGDRDRGIRLGLDYERRADPLEARNWLTDDRLRTIGFGLNVPITAPEAQDSYARALPRVAWVAFEYDGPAWGEIERQRRVREPDPRHPGATYPAPSRLVPVDAAADAESLVGRYPNGHLIVRASVRLGYIPPGQKGPLVYGWIDEVIPPAVHVPREYREVFENLPASSGTPRYEVDLVVGRLGIPYVDGARRR